MSARRRSAIRGIFHDDPGPREDLPADERADLLKIEQKGHTAPLSIAFGGCNMQRNTTLNLPDKLVSRAKAYAAEHGTTMTAIIRSHLEAVTSSGENPIAHDPLLAYSQGQLSRSEAIRMLGLRDYAELLVALGDADLPMPSAPPHEIENQATTFTKLWRQS